MCGQVRIGVVRSGKIRTGGVNEGKDRISELMSGQVKLGRDLKRPAQR